MNPTTKIAAAAAAAYFVGYKHARRLGLPPIVGALLAYVVADFILDRVG